MTRPAVLSLLIGMAVAVPAAAQSLQPRPIPAAGTEVFRELLGIEGLKPIAHPDELIDPGAAVVVFIGPPQLPPEFGPAAALARGVLQAGGSVLIASAQPLDLDSFFPFPTAARITGEPVVARQNGDRWAEDPTRPLGAVGADRLDDTGWAQFVGLGRIHTVRPSTVRVDRASPYTAVVLVKYGYSCRYGGAAVRRFPLDEDVLAAGGAGDAGHPFRSLVVADAGVFSNQVLAAHVADGRPSANLAFALRTARWLRGPEDAPRSRCLFVDHGAVRDRFDELGLGRATVPAPPLPPVPVPDPLDPKIQAMLTDAANRGLARIEDGNWVNNALAGEPGQDDRRFARALTVLAVLAGVAAGMWLMARSRTTRHAPDVLLPPRELGPAADIPIGSVAYRRAELVRAGNLTEPVRDYLRGVFAGCGLPAARAGDPAPELDATGPGSRGLRRDFTAVWDAVFGAHAKPITPDVWKELEPMVDEIRRAAAAGRLRFPAGGPA